MGNTNTNWSHKTDSDIVKQIGEFIKHTRLQQNKSQAELAKAAGLNRWTVSQIETGDSITLTSLIQILRALECLYVLKEFEFSEEISPLEYAKLKKQQKERVRKNTSKKDDKNYLGW